MRTRWYDQAVISLEEELVQGNISQAEFDQQMRDLNAEFREAENEAAEQARQDFRERY